MTLDPQTSDGVAIGATASAAVAIEPTSKTRRALDRVSGSRFGLPSAFFVLTVVLCSLSSWSVSFWNDEAITVSAARRSTAELWAMLQNIDIVHGAYYAFMHFWIGAFGGSEFAARLPSAIAVAVAVAGTVSLARMLGGTRFAVYAGCAALSLPRLTWAGIEARPFAATAAIAVVATLILNAALIRGTRWHWVAYSLIMALGIITNIYLLLLLGAHLVTLGLLKTERAPMRRFLAAAFASVIIGLPVLLGASSQRGQLGTLGERNPIALLRMILVNQFFLGETPSPAATSPVFDSLWRAAAVLAAVIGIGTVGWALIRGRRYSVIPAGRLLAFTVPWVLGPAIVIAIVAVLVTPVFQPRYFTFAAPAMAMLLAFAVTCIRSRGIRWTLTLVYLACVITVYSSQRLPESKSGSDWASASAWIESNARAGDAIYFTPRYPPIRGMGTWTDRRMAYGYPSAFSRLDDITLESTGAATGTLDGWSAALSTRADELRTHDTVWVVYGRGYPKQIIKADRMFLASSGFVPAATTNGTDTVIVEYERTAHASQ